MYWSLLFRHATGWDKDQVFAGMIAVAELIAHGSVSRVTVKPDAGFSRTELAQELDRNNIGNRMLFGGNSASTGLCAITP